MDGEVPRDWHRGNQRLRSSRKRRKRLKWSERIVDWTRNLVAFLFSNVGIVCLVVGYTIAGAFLFAGIEANFSLNITSEVSNLRNDTAIKLWKLTYEVGPL